MSLSRIVAAAAAVACVAVPGVSPATAQQEPPAGGGLRQLGNCDDLRDWMRDEIAPRVSEHGPPVLYRGGPAPMPMAADAAAAPGGAAPQHSETNVQVEGVDEPDIVKTDGRRIVAVAGTALHLASADGAELLDSIDLGGNQHGAELLMAEDRVMVLAQTWDGGGSRTQVTQVDVAGDKLKVSGRYAMEGSYVSARMSGGDVARLVVETHPEERLPFLAPIRDGEAAQAKATEVNQQTVDEAEDEQLLPRLQQLTPSGQVVNEQPLVSCDQIHVPGEFAGFGMVTVVTVDLSEGVAAASPDTGAGVMASGQTVYSSLDHLYVATPEWIDWQALPEDEPWARSQQQGTDIHRFDISDPKGARYQMSGHVDGTLLNQFAMDEHEGNLRVATTTGSQWGQGEEQSESHVTVLAPRGLSGLRQIGKVSGLGRGETIRSVRFIGDVGYVVTFRQTDPLYTIDLAEPSAPRVAGELKILGYSAYLHPIDEGHLIGVGQDATPEGERLGTQIALFDVTDPAAPTRVAQAALANSSTPVEWDHHAFMWWPDTSLAAIPVSARADDPFKGLIGYTVDAQTAAIRELGRVSHPTQAAVEEPVQVPHVSRSFVIGDRLWTLSDAGLAHSDVASLTDTQFLPFS